MSLFLSYKYTGVEPERLLAEMEIMKRCAQYNHVNLLSSVFYEDHFRKQGMTTDEIYQHCTDVLQKPQGCVLAYIQYPEESKGMRIELEYAKKLNQRYVLCINKRHSGLERVRPYIEYANEVVEYDILDEIAQYRFSSGLHTMYGHCASGFILNADSTKTLLVFHKKLQRRIQPGGHVDEGETLEETVVREVLEETGLQAGFHPQHTLRRGIEGSLEYGEEMIVPYLIRKYDYRAIKKQYDFQIDNWYILLADDSEVINDDNAIEQVQWFNKQEGLEAVGHDPKLKYLIEELMV